MNAKTALVAAAALFAVSAVRAQAPPEIGDVEAVLNAAAAERSSVPTPAAAPVQALPPELSPRDDQGRVFGLPDGTYQSDGLLYSKTFLVPNLRFHSVRKIGNGVIEAATTASLMGRPLAAASAKLKVDPTGGGRFDLLDLDSPLGTAYKKAGEGRCDRSGCTFTAVVMNGALTLTETWVPGAAGFDIVQCSQIFHGTRAVYSAAFRSSPP